MQFPFACAGLKSLHVEQVGRASSVLALGVCGFCFQVRRRNNVLRMPCPALPRPAVLQGEMVVADVHCAKCGDRIGWKFCKAEDHDNDSQARARGLPAYGCTAQHPGTLNWCFWGRGQAPQPSTRGAESTPQLAEQGSACAQVGRYGIVTSAFERV